jgi:hypothetical protein
MRTFGPDRDGLPVRYLLVAMEPSARWVTRYVRNGKSLDDARNFGGAKPDGDSVLQFAAREWLCADKETFLLTDIAKCAVLNTKDHPAARTASWRWNNCAPIIRQEAALFHLKAVVAVGSGVRDALRGRDWVERQPLFRVLHFSNVAASHRATILGAEADRALDADVVNRYRAFVRERRISLGHREEKDGEMRISSGTRLLLAVYRKQLGDIKAAMTSGAPPQ